MKLQLALDEMNLVDALRFADKVAEHVDIIEVGTPFVMDEGMRGVREFHRFFPDKEILADLKIMDGGYQAMPMRQVLLMLQSWVFLIT